MGINNASINFSSKSKDYTTVWTQNPLKTTVAYEMIKKIDGKHEI